MLTDTCGYLEMETGPRSNNIVQGRRGSQSQDFDTLQMETPVFGVPGNPI